jgi:twinkle protein
VNESTFLYHTSCASCGSSDANSIYDDGHSYCHSCNVRVANYVEGRTTPHIPQMVTKKKKEVTTMNIDEYNKATYKPISDRNINLDTCKQYGVKTDERGNEWYPYCDNEGTITGFKVKNPKEKSFRIEGNVTGKLFGYQLFQQPGKFLTITEGETDTLAAYQMNGSKWPHLSIPTGAQSAVKAIKNNLEYLEAFDQVVLNFDNDDAGREATSKVSDIFTPSKVKVLQLKNYKDACDYLKHNKQAAYIQEWWGSKTYTPAGIISSDSTWDLISEEDGFASIDYPWKGLNDMLYGIRPQELITLTSGSGLGKSSIIRELIHYLVKNSEENVGVMMLEESVRRASLGVMGIEAERPLHIPKIYQETTKEELRNYWENTMGTGRLFFFDHFGSTSEETIMQRMRYMVKGLDCKFVFLDHLSIVVSGMEGDDERRLIDRLMTKLRTFVQETNCTLFLVSHLRRPSGDKGHENGGEVSLSQLRGSHAIAQLSDTVVGIERNQQDADETIRNQSLLRVLKARVSGLTGPATKLQYDLDTGRLEEINGVNELDDEEF